MEPLLRGKGRERAGRGDKAWGSRQSAVGKGEEVAAEVVKPWNLQMSMSGRDGEVKQRVMSLQIPGCMHCGEVEVRAGVCVAGHCSKA